jgi:hypothetical protein
VFTKRALRIFGPTMDEVGREWRKLRNEELYNLYYLQNITMLTSSTEDEMNGACSL